MKKILIVLVLLWASKNYAQSHPFKITGTLQDEKLKTPIEAATIHLEKLKDSSIVSYTISDDKGYFKLEGKSFYKKLKMVVSFVGKDPYTKSIDLSKKSDYALGKIPLKEEGNVLSEVVIKSRAPITVKKDTLEFNVKSFKTKKDANVEDLLKKLPGVEVDEQGKITINGKPVNKILVNGKPFFGNDPSITTKNLSKEIIEKVQITDTKTKSEAFSGEKDDNNNKTINLTIKKENNKGWFGRVSAGAGTDKRYEAATMVNRFNNDRRISVLASKNNINSPGFSFGELEKMFGGGLWISGNGSINVGGQRFGGGQGIVRSTTAGFTYGDSFGKTLETNVNYIYSGSDSNNDAKRNRETTLPTGKFFSESVTNSNNNNENHSVDAEIDIEIDSTFLINITPRFISNTREDFFNRNESSFDADRKLINRSRVNTRSDSKANNFENEIELTKRFSKGSFIRARLTNQIDKTTSNSFNISTAEFFDATTADINRNQHSAVQNNLNAIRSSVKYRHALIAKKLFIDFDYRYNQNERENVNNTYDFDAVSNSYSNFNTNLSSNFTSNDITKTPRIGMNYKGKKWSFNFDAGYMMRTLENKDKLRPNLTFSKDFNAFEFDSRFRYRFDSKASISINYEIRNDAPTIQQLQPFTNESNPLNLITGNPFLKPIQRHWFYVNFNKFNWQKGTGIYLYGGGGFTNNQVVSKSTIDANLIRRTTYENVDGSYNIWGGSFYNKKFKLDSLSAVKLRVGVYFNRNRSINFFNDVKYRSVNNNVSPNLGFTYTYDKIISIEPRYTINIGKSTFDLANFNDQNFVRHNLDINTRTNFPKKLEWRNNIRYSYNPQVVGFNQSAWFWNSTLSYSVLKDQGTITLKAYDLLNQNNNVRRTATSNYIEDAESTVLQQYFMLGFSWKFNSLGKKGKIREFNYNF